MKINLLLLLFVPITHLASSQNVLKGKVTDEQQQPRHGVSVIKIGTTNGVFTDIVAGQAVDKIIAKNDSPTRAD
jgi:hypothetical protein